MPMRESSNMRGEWRGLTSSYCSAAGSRGRYSTPQKTAVTIVAEGPAAAKMQQHSFPVQGTSCDTAPAYNPCHTVHHDMGCCRAGRGEDGTWQVFKIWKETGDADGCILVYRVAERP